MLDKFKVGQFVELVRVFTYDEVCMFAEISGDVNPVHINKEFASSTQFGKPIVHGLFVSSVFSALIANELPGPGSIYLHQSLDFKAPVYHNYKVKFKVEILSIRSDKPIFELSTTCVDENDKILIEGKAIVLKK